MMWENTVIFPLHDSIGGGGARSTKRHCSTDRLSGCFTTDQGAPEESRVRLHTSSPEGLIGWRMKMRSKNFGRFALLLIILLIPNVSSLNLFKLFPNPDRSSEDETAIPVRDHGLLGGILSGIGHVTGGVTSTAGKVIDGVRTTIDGAVYDFGEAIGAISSKFNPSIFPGTNWCGAGDRARGFDDVGLFGTADNCCRTHDSCQDNIPPGEAVNGLLNDKPYTLSHCDCDETFYWCLKNSSSLIAKKIGVTFFNILRMPCFKLDYPSKCADESSGEKCNDHDQPDSSSSKIWKWLEPKHF